MARYARTKSESGVYHAVLRGINRQSLFECDADYARFLEILSDVKALSGFVLPGYCLMGNHVHLLIHCAREPIGLVFKRIGVRYALWFNRKYARNGHLFQDRFGSETIDDDGRLLAALRYICDNPVKAGLCGRAEDYEWSSCREYVFRADGPTDTADALKMFSADPAVAAARFKEFVRTETDERFLDAEDAAERSDDACRERAKRLCGIGTTAQFQALTPAERDRNIRILRESGMSIRRISRLTGISVGIVRAR
jgi:REP element-mobilizing transposase RayT